MKTILKIILAAVCICASGFSQIPLGGITAGGGGFGTFTYANCAWGTGPGAYPGVGCDSSGSSATPIVDVMTSAGEFVSLTLAISSGATVTGVAGCENSGCSTTQAFTQAYTPCAISGDGIYATTYYKVNAAAYVAIKLTLSTNAAQGWIGAASATAPSTVAINGTPSCTNTITGTSWNTGTTTPSYNGAFFAAVFMAGGANTSTLAAGTAVAWDGAFIQNAVNTGVPGIVFETYVQPTAAALAGTATSTHNYTGMGVLGAVVAFDVQ